MKWARTSRVETSARFCPALCSTTGFRFCLVCGSAGDAVRQRHGQQRAKKQDMDADQPAEMVRVVVFDVHESLEHLDRRDRDNRGYQLLLEVAEIDLGHPVRPVVIGRLDAGDEILI